MSGAPAVWTHTHLIEVDFSGIEAVLVGAFARDPLVYRMAKLGLHAYVASHLVQQPVSLQQSDEDIAAAFAAIKKAHKTPYNKAKRTVHGCFSGDHEVLTPFGWVRLDQYNWQDPIAEWDPADASLTFRVPLDRYVRHYEGEMVSLDGTSLAAFVTPDHGFPVRTSQGHYRRYSAQDLPKANSLPLVGQMTGTETPATHDVQLYAAIQADGHLTPDGTTVVFHLKRLRKRRRLEALLNPYPYRHGHNADGSTSYRIAAKDLAHILKWFETGPGKYFDLSTILTWTAATRRVFLDELIEWDGTTHRGCRSYLTTLKHNADVVQAVAHCTDQQALLRTTVRLGRRPLYRVSFNRRKYAALESVERGTLQWSGMIYCPKTTTGYFLVRGNGKVYVSGNTAYGMTPQGMALMFPDLYRSPAEAEHVQDVYFAVAPGVKPWQAAVQQRAHDQGYLGGPAKYGHTFLTDDNAHPFGYKHYFYGVLAHKALTDDQVGRAQAQHLPVFEMHGRWFQKILGPEAKSCIAFYPQSTAAGILKEVLLALFADKDHTSYIGDAWFGRTPLRAPIHDSILLEAPPKQIDRVLECTYGEMLRPIEEMPIPPEWGMGELVTIGVEGKMGRSWDAMEKVYDPPGGFQPLVDIAADRTYFPATEAEEEDVLDLMVARRARVSA